MCICIKEIKIATTGFEIDVMPTYMRNLKQVLLWRNETLNTHTPLISLIFSNRYIFTSASILDRSSDFHRRRLLSRLDSPSSE